MTKGKLTVHCGPMYSDKTTRLITIFNSKDPKTTICFKPTLDNRYGDSAHLHTHTGLKAPATLIDSQNPDQMIGYSSGFKLVLIDEIQFFDKSLINVIDSLLNSGINVIASGLDLDSSAKPFGQTLKLAKVLNAKIVQHTAICDSCKAKATLTYAKIIKISQVSVGASDQYGPACKNCHPKLEKLGKIPKKIKPINKPLQKKLVALGIYPAFASWLSDIKSPFIRKSFSNQKNKWPRIEIGGDCMRIGKTTAFNVITKGLIKNNWPVFPSKEAWEDNPHLKKSYQDLSTALLHSQKWFAKNKYAQLKKNISDQVLVQDVHPEMDFSYATTNALMGRLSLKQFDSYCEYYNLLNWKTIPAPDLLVYITASNKILVDRAQKAIRDFEKVDSNYFLVMKIINQFWLNKIKKNINLLVVNTDNFDYSKDQITKESLVNMVISNLNKNGWQSSSNLNSKKTIKNNTHIIKPSKPSKSTKSTQNLSIKKNLLNKPLNSSLITNIKNSKLVVMSGLPGSGKSYWSKKLKKDYGFTILSSDKVRFTKVFKNQKNFLNKNSDYTKTRHLVYSLLHKKAQKLLALDKKVVIDATYLGPQINELTSLVKELDLIDETLIIVVKTSIDIIKSRLKKIKKKVSKDRSYSKGWLSAYAWFTKNLATGAIRYPDQKKDIVKVAELWNQ